MLRAPQWTAEVRSIRACWTQAPLGASIRCRRSPVQGVGPQRRGGLVAGDFGSTPLAALGDGTFQGTAAGAQPLQHYQYRDPERRCAADPNRSARPARRLRPRRPRAGGCPLQSGWPHLEQLRPSHGLPGGDVPELHVGTFVDPTGTGTGTYSSAATKLADLAQLGINVVELMPVAEFPGSYSWGYNPLYPSAPCRAYGSPADLQAFINQAHQLGIAVILDVVFNHFGLDGSGRHHRSRCGALMDLAMAGASISRRSPRPPSGRARPSECRRCTI